MRITGFNASFLFVDAEPTWLNAALVFSASTYTFEQAESAALSLAPKIEALSDARLVGLTITKVYGLTPNNIPAYTSDITRLGIVVISLENTDYTYLAVPSVDMNKVLRDLSGRYTYVLDGSDSDVLNLASLMGIISDELGVLSDSIIIAGVAQ